VCPARGCHALALDAGGAGRTLREREGLLTALLHRVVFPAEQRDAKKADDAAARFAKPLGVLDGALAGRDYLLGPQFSAADLNVASVMAWAPMAKLDLASAPNAAAWL
jgi:glutathione S-transferase